MTISYTVTIDDLVAFNLQYHQSSAASRQRQRQGQRLLAGLPLLCGLGMALAMQSAVPLLAAAAVAAWAALTYPARLRQAISRAVVRAYREGRNLALLGDHALDFGADGFEVRTAVSRLFYAYEAIERVEVTDSHTFIYVGANQAFIIPHTAADSDAADFRAQLAEHMAGRGRERMVFPVETPLRQTVDS